MLQGANVVLSGSMKIMVWNQISRKHFIQIWFEADSNILFIKKCCFQKQSKLPQQQQTIFHFAKFETSLVRKMLWKMHSSTKKKRKKPLIKCFRSIHRHPKLMQIDISRQLLRWTQVPKLKNNSSPKKMATSSSAPLWRNKNGS